MRILTPETIDAERFWSKVAKGPGCWEWQAGKFDDGYGCFWSNGCTNRAHRISYVLVNGVIPDGMFIDHICHNKGCVNPDHLRPVTTKQNGEHRSGAQTNSTTGIRGVFWRPSRQKWFGAVMHNRKRHWVGTFDTAEEAAEAVREARLRIFTHSDMDK